MVLVEGAGVARVRTEDGKDPNDDEAGLLKELMFSNALLTLRGVCADLISVEDRMHE